MTCMTVYICATPERRGMAGGEWCEGGLGFVRCLGCVVAAVSSLVAGPARWVGGGWGAALPPEGGRGGDFKRYPMSS